MAEAPNWNSLSESPPDVSRGTPDWNQLSDRPPPQPEPTPSPQGSNEAPNWDDLKTPEEHQGGVGQALLAAERGLERGLTGGISDVIASKYRNALEGTTNEEVLENKEAHPIASLAGEIGGTAGLLAGTGGLGLAAPEGAGLLAKIASNAAQGALISGTSAVSNDLAFGDPNATASKIASDAGISALYGGLLGGAGTALLSGASGTIKSLGKFTKALASPDLSISPESLGPVDKIRMGLFAGMNNPEAKEAVATSTSKALNSLNDITSVENLGLTADRTQKPIVDGFQNAKKSFLKEFGDGKGAIDPDEVTSFITNPAAKNSTQQTIAFNHYMKAIKDLSGVTLQDADMNGALREATGALSDWEGALADAHFSTPHADIEYGSPGETKPYSTKFDLAPGEKITPNYSEGVTIQGGEGTTRVSSFGNEEVSPFEENRGFSLTRIKSMMEKYQKEVSDLVEKQQSEVPLKATDISEPIVEAKQAGNAIQNITQAKTSFANKPEPLGAGIATIAAHFPYGSQLLGLYSAIRNYAGDGGLYRLGESLASPLKVLDGIAKTTQRVDERIGDKARLIFTGASSQVKRREKSHE